MGLATPLSNAHPARADHLGVSEDTENPSNRANEEEEMAERFSPATEKDLREAGWSPGRRAVSQFLRWRDELTGAGVNVSAAAEAVLLEFGDLIIGSPAKGEEVATKTVTINASGFVESEAAREWIRKVEAGIGGPACPIGSVEEGQAALFIGTTGRVFMFFEPKSMWDFGETFDDALERLLRGRAALRKWRLS